MVRLRRLPGNVFLKKLPKSVDIGVDPKLRGLKPSTGPLVNKEAEIANAGRLPRANSGVNKIGGVPCGSVPYGKPKMGLRYKPANLENFPIITAGKKMWIARSIKHPGVLTKEANRKGMTVKEFCSNLPNSVSTTTKRRCNLAKTLSKLKLKDKKGGAIPVSSKLIKVRSRAKTLGGKYVTGSRRQTPI